MFDPTHSIGGGAYTEVSPDDCASSVFAALELDVAVVSSGFGELPDGTFPVRVGAYSLVHYEPAMLVSYPDAEVSFSDGNDYFDKGGRFLGVIHNELGYRSVSAFPLPRISDDGTVDFSENECFPDEHQGGDRMKVDELIAAARECGPSDASSAYGARALSKCAGELGCSVRGYAAWCDFQ